MSSLPAVFDQVDERTLEILERRRGVGGIKRRGWLVRRALLAADLFGLSLSFLIASLLFGVGGSRANHLGEIGEYAIFLFSLPAWVVVAKLYGLYDRDEERADHTTADDFSGVFHLVTVTSWLLYATAYLIPIAHPAFPKILVFWAAAVVLIPAARALGRAYCHTRIEYLQNTAIVGAGDVGQSLARKLLNHPEYGLNLVGFVDAEPREQAPDLEHLALLGEPSELEELVELLDIERVIFAFSNDEHDTLLDLIRRLSDCGVQVDVVPRLFEVVSPGVTMHAVEGVPVISLPPMRLSRSSRLLKRGWDVVIASLTLLILAPLFAVVAVVIKFDSRGPVFFRQVRMGRDGTVFRIWKFRTMSADAEDQKDGVRHLNAHIGGGDARMFKIVDDPRITRVGNVLRRYSIDELPQLLNVVVGEMSLVGPRPLILEEARHVEDWGLRRLDLRPGITGLWQVLGRSDIPFGEMVRLDYLYVATWSLKNDFVLMLRTIPVLFRPHRGVA
jgi:exopolysaccharide biosynthesis polyprenyl glycosylphosphotransferase